MQLPLPDTAPEQTPAWDALYAAAKRMPGELRLVATGPLTNVAIALTKYPDLHGLLHSIALMGGGTAMIGDPSGRTDMRKMMTTETIDHNVECFKKQMSRFIEFGEGKARIVNNADWLRNLNFLDFMRDIGPCFSVNEMLRARCYVKRTLTILRLKLANIFLTNSAYGRSRHFKNERF